MERSEIKALIFDLGGVVIDYTFDRVFATWGRIYNRDPQEIRQRFEWDDAFRALERGTIAPGDYIEYLGKKLNISFTPKTFDAGWNAIYLGIRPGIEELLRELEAEFRLVALTNTTAMHTPVWRQRYGSRLTMFGEIFASNEIRARKPEPEAFVQVLEYLEASPRDVLFFDDFPPYLEGAEKLGIMSFLVTSPDEIRAGLKAAFG